MLHRALFAGMAVGSFLAPVAGLAAPRGLSISPPPTAWSARAIQRPAATAGTAPRPLIATCNLPEPAQVVRSTNTVMAWLANDAALGELPASLEEAPPLPPEIEWGPAEAEIPAVYPVDAILSRWSKASRGLEAMNPARERRLSRQWRGDHNGHEIAVLTTLQGPVDAGALSEHYEWHLVASDAERVTVLAIPRDTVDRLFVHRFELVLDAQTDLPTQVQFLDRSGQPRSDQLALGALRRLPVREPARLPATARLLPIGEAGRSPVRTAGFEREANGDEEPISTKAVGIPAAYEAESENESNGWNDVVRNGPSALARWITRAGSQVRLTLQRLYRPIDPRGRDVPRAAPRG